jgi:hypothetical protein
MAAPPSATPETLSAMRPANKFGPRLRASAKHVTATRAIDMSTTAAAQTPGTASLLTVRDIAS